MVKLPLPVTQMGAEAAVLRPLSLSLICFLAPPSKKNIKKIMHLWLGIAKRDFQVLSHFPK